jgi:hypothetical protein
VEFIALRAETEGDYRGHQGFEEFLADSLDHFESFSRISSLGRNAEVAPRADLAIAFA